MRSLKGKVIAVTGAGSGIGRALALALAARGAQVVLADRNPESLAQTSRLLGNAHHMARALDITEPGALERLARQAQGTFGKIDGLINNAGLTVVAPFEATPREDFDRVMDVNFKAVVEGCRVFLPYIRAAAQQEGHGWLVNVSSVFGMMAYPTQSAYNASKFAVKGFTECLRAELEVTDPALQIVCVHPGGIKTNILQSAKFIKGMSGGTDGAMSAEQFEKIAKTTPEQAAQTILRGMERGDVRVLIGPDARLIDWMVRLFPVRHRHFLKRLFK